jgi:hypothetical protein
MSRFAVEHRQERQVTGPEIMTGNRQHPSMQRGDRVDRVTMQRVERRIGLRLFGRWFGYESSTTERQLESLQLTEAEGLVALAPPARNGQMALAGGGVLAVALLGGAIGALLVPVAPQATVGAPLLTTLPASRPIAPVADDAEPRRSERRALIAVDRTPSPPAASIGVPGTAVLDPDPDSQAQTGLSLAQARSAALASGEPAYWNEGARNGVVVAGPERSENGQLCRLVAIFTRTDGDRGSTSSTTQCRAADGTPGG